MEDSDELCTFNWKYCFTTSSCDASIYVLFFTCGCSCLLAIASILGLIYYLLRNDDNENPDSVLLWKYNLSAVINVKHNSLQFRRKNLTPIEPSVGPIGKTQPTSLGYSASQRYGETFVFNGWQILLKEMSLKRSSLPERSFQFKAEVRKLLKFSMEPNFVRFYGFALDNLSINCIEEYCRRGSLLDVIDGRMTIELFHQVTWINQIVEGMNYLHKIVKWAHGNLIASNCLITSKLQLKITDIVLPCLRPLLLSLSNLANYQFLYKAPELLRLPHPQREATFEGDVYSFGIIVHHLGYRQGVFGILATKTTPTEIVKQVQQTGKKIPSRPPFHSSVKCDSHLMKLMAACWEEDPQLRPSWDHIKSHLMKKLIKKYHRDVLNDYAFLLEKKEQMVKNANKRVSHAKVDQDPTVGAKIELIRRMIPYELLPEICNIKPRIPHTSGTCTLTFSDIKNFTVICDQLDPSKVAILLNELYQMIDTILESRHQQFVRKIETIGDAYMAACGLCPKYENHAALICVLACDIQQKLKRFVPSVTELATRGHKIEMRTGVHTGTATSSIIGALCPRYVVLGETVIIAEEMEKTGEPGQVQISEKTHSELQTKNNLKSFKVTPRTNSDGSIYAVDCESGKFATYWISQKQNVTHS